MPVKDRPLTLSLRNDLAEIGRIAPLVAGYCTERGLSEDIANTLNLALDELLSNTITYGYGDGAPHVIEIELALQGRHMTLTIRDDAHAFDPTAAPAPDIEAELDDRPMGGLGIHLVRSLMDGMDYRRVGNKNQLVLTKHIKA